jgi:hypothetical protein
VAPWEWERRWPKLTKRLVEAVEPEARLRPTMAVHAEVERLAGILPSDPEAAQAARSLAANPARLGAMRRKR